jgi:hypothetical protein
VALTAQWGDGMNEAAAAASTIGDDATSTRIAACANCGSIGEGSFCCSCGQKRFSVGDLGIKHACHHVLHELLSFDGKILGSLRSLFLRPGELTLDFIEGRRARHVHPIRLFVVFLALFFFFVPVNPLIEIGANVSQGMQRIDPALRARLEERVARNGVTLETVLENVDAQLRAISKPLDLGLVIGNGVLLWLLFRKRRRYLAENLTMALHLASFNTGVQLVIGWARLYEPAKALVSVLVLAIAAAYFLLAARRVYGGSWLGLAVKYVVIYAAQVLLVLTTIAIVLLAHLAQALP